MDKHAIEVLHLNAVRTVLTYIWHTHRFIHAGQTVITISACEFNIQGELHRYLHVIIIFPTVRKRTHTDNLSRTAAFISVYFISLCQLRDFFLIA